MAYLAHPYAPTQNSLATKEFNLMDTGNIAYNIMLDYPNLTIISPLHVYSFFEGKGMEETDILRYDFRLLME